MTFPHPWLARVARLLVVLAAVELVFTAVLLLLPSPSLGWQGWRVVEAWQFVATVDDAVQTAGRQLAVFAGVFGPLGWLLAAGLFRMAATGQLSAGGSAGRLCLVGRWPAAVVAWMAAYAVIPAVVAWAGPVPAGSELRARVRIVVGQGGRVAPMTGPLGISNGMMTSFGSPNAEATPTEYAGRLAICLLSEGQMLFSRLRPPLIVTCLCAAVFCLGRPDTDAET